MPTQKLKPIRCPRCRGKCYSDDPQNPRSDIWCFWCCEWVPPLGFKPAAYVPRLEEQHAKYDWHVDQYGFIVDDIDFRIEQLLQNNEMVTVSGIAKKVHCSNGDARIALERLVHIGVAEKIKYGPLSRWFGYQKKKEEYIEDPIRQSSQHSFVS